MIPVFWWIWYEAARGQPIRTYAKPARPPGGGPIVPRPAPITVKLSLAPSWTKEGVF